MIFVPHNHASVVLQPTHQAFNFPSAFVSPKRSAILSFRFASVASVRRYHLYTLCFERLIKRITVVGAVPDEPLRSLFSKACLESVLNKGDFMRRSTFNVYGEWKTSAVCNCHDLRTFAPLGLSNFEPPFFATTKVPSMKHSVRSISPRSCKSQAKDCNTLSRTLSLTQRWKRRWHVWYGGYRSGRSFHGAPVRSIQRIPLSTSRLSRQGRPLLSSLSTGFGISGSSTAHCSSVRSNFYATPEMMFQLNYFSVAHL
jgi:hypothetical protein